MTNKSKNSYFFPLSLLVIYALANVYFQFLPLLKTFSYEFAALNGMLIFVISLFTAIYFVKNEITDFKYLYFATLFFLPAIISLTFNKFSGTCPVSFGYSFYLIIVLPAEILGWSLGNFSASIFRNFLANLSGLFFFVLFLAASFFEFYFYPQIYFFNQTFLFFPGTAYDYLIQIKSNWYYFRIFTLIFALIAFIFASLNYKATFGSRILRFFSFLLIYLIFWFLKPYLGFATNNFRIESALKGKISTEHFTIFLPDTVNPSTKKIIALNHEFYYKELTEYLHLDFKGKIKSFVFGDDKEKEKIFGAKNADVTKPWLNEMFLSLPTYRITLKHELAHVLSGAFGANIFKVAKNINPMLIEGFAVACSDNFDDYSIHYPAKLIRETGKKITPVKLFNGFKYFNLNSDISYVYSGSFIKYLMDYYGLRKVKKLYRTGNFKFAFNTDSLTLQKNYFTFLDSLKVKVNPFRADYYFGHAPIVRKYCVRNISIMREQADRLLIQKKLEKAKKLYLKMFEKLNDAYSLKSIAEIYLKLKKYKQSAILLEQFSKRFLHSSYYPVLRLLLAESYYKASLFKESVSTAVEIIKHNYHPAFNNRASLLITLSKLKVLTDTLNEKEKYSLLRKLAFNVNAGFIFPLIERYGKNSVKLEEILNKFAVSNNIFKYNTGYFYLKLAKISEALYYPALAKKFIRKSLRFNENRFRLPVIKEELKKINFMISNWNKYENKAKG